MTARENLLDVLEHDEEEMTWQWKEVFGLRCRSSSLSQHYMAQ